MVHDLTENDLIIVSSIAGGYWQDHPDMLREIAKSKAHKICITQVENIPYQEPVSYTHLDVYKRQPPSYIIKKISEL